MSGFEREEDVREVRSDLTVVRDLLTDSGIELAKKANTGALWGMIATVIGCRDFGHQLRGCRLGSQGYLTPDFGCSPSGAPAINLRRR